MHTHMPIANGYIHWVGEYEFMCVGVAHACMHPAHTHTHTHTHKCMLILIAND